MKPSGSLSIGEARRLALTAQGFGEVPTGRQTSARLLSTIQRLGMLQMDSVNVLARAHYIPAFSRKGAYRLDVLDELAYGRRRLFEYWGRMASLLPVELHPLLRFKMDGGHHHRYVAWAKANKRVVDHILREVTKRGPLAASDLESTGKRPPGPWWGRTPEKVALEWLFANGVITTSSRRNFEKVYELTERVLPQEVIDSPTKAPEEQRKALLEIAARALGVGTAADIAYYFNQPKKVAQPLIEELAEAGRLIPSRVDGWGETAYLSPGVKAPNPIGRAAIISPFDSLMWERGRTERLFGMRYRIEIYVPESKREFGYYVLPFLMDERLVARVDLKADRKRLRLLVQAAHIEPGEKARSVAARLADHLSEAADWLDLEEAVGERRGDLAVALLRAGLRPAG